MGTTKARMRIDEIIATLRQHLPELRQRYGVTYLGLFGSWVRGEQTPGSDLDVLVELDDRGLTLFDFLDLEEHLSQLLDVKVDLVERGTLKPHIGRHIAEEVQPV